MLEDKFEKALEDLKKESPSRLLAKFASIFLIFFLGILFAIIGVILLAVIV